MTRREWFALTGIAGAAACARKKGSGYPGYALIATSGENSVAVVDLTTFRVLSPIEVGAPPTAIVPASQGGQSFALTPSTGTVHLIDRSLRVIRKSKVADELSELRLSPDGKRLFSVAAHARELVELDPQDLRILTRQQLAGEPISLDIGTDGSVAVASETGIELFGRGRHSAEMKGSIRSIHFRKDGKVLVVALSKDKALSLLNLPSLQVAAELPLAMEPQNLCFDPDGGQLFVTGPGMDSIAVVFPYQFEVEQTILAGRDPGAMVCSEAPYSYLYVANGSGADVSILNMNTRKLMAVVAVGERPCYLTITPDSQYVLVLSEGSGDMAVIHVPSIRALPSRMGASLFTMLPVGSKPVHAAVVKRY